MFIIGDGTNLYDFTYVENVAHAHICAERALASEEKVAEKASGEAYFITNTEPVKFWDFISFILGGLGYARPRIKVPVRIVMPIAHMVEAVYTAFAPYGMNVPNFTPSRVRLLSCNRTFNCTKASDRLGYTPIVPLQEGLNRTIKAFSHLRAELYRKEHPSKASTYLGGGKVAGIFLWSDTRQTLAAMVVLVVIYFGFVAPGYTMITAVSKLLSWASIFLFIHGRAPTKISAFKMEKIPESKFHLSEDMPRKTASAMASSWNSAVNDVKTLCYGNDWLLFLKMALTLLILSIIASSSLKNVFAKVIPYMFIAFPFYDNNEEQIDAILLQIISIVSKIKSDNMGKLSSIKVGKSE